MYMKEMLKYKSNLILLLCLSIIQAQYSIQSYETIIRTISQCVPGYMSGEALHRQEFFASGMLILVIITIF
ncbi:MAG TPA: hypothetical protein DCO75_02855 [Fibrobacteres bacterium]|nr:hypothetical protein [Fibrobacterota bacterium]